MSFEFFEMWTSTQIQYLSSERAMWVNDCMMNEKLSKAMTN